VIDYDAYLIMVCFPLAICKITVITSIAMSNSTILINLRQSNNIAKEFSQ